MSYGRCECGQAPKVRRDGGCQACEDIDSLRNNKGREATGPGMHKTGFSDLEVEIWQALASGPKTVNEIWRLIGVQRKRGTIQTSLSRAAKRGWFMRKGAVGRAVLWGRGRAPGRWSAREMRLDAA